MNNAGLISHHSDIFESKEKKYFANILTRWKFRNQTFPNVGQFN